MSLLYSTWKLVIDSIEKKKSIAELGCRDGYFAKMCTDSGLYYNFGVDFSFEAVKRAENINPDKVSSFYVGNITDKEIIKKACVQQVVVCVNVLQYFSLDSDLKLMNVLPKGKRFIFSVPNYNDERFEKFFKTSHDVEDRFVSCFSVLNYIGEANIGDSKVKKSFVFEAIK